MINYDPADFVFFIMKFLKITSYIILCKLFALLLRPHPTPPSPSPRPRYYQTLILHYSEIILIMALVFLKKIFPIFVAPSYSLGAMI